LAVDKYVDFISTPFTNIELSVPLTFKLPLTYNLYALFGIVAEPIETEFSV